MRGKISLPCCLWSLYFVAPSAHSGHFVMDDLDFIKVEPKSLSDSWSYEMVRYEMILLMDTKSMFAYCSVWF